MSIKLLIVPIGETRTTDEQVVGTVVDRGDKSYRWVKNGGTASLAAKAAAVFITPDTTGLTVVGLSNSSSAAVTAPAGVIVATIAAGSYGWVQRKGIASATVRQPKTADITAGTPLRAATTTADVGSWAQPVTGSTTEIYARGGVTPIAKVTKAGAVAYTARSVIVDCI